MKTQKMIVIVVSVCLMAFFSVSSFAKTYKHKNINTRSVDIDAIANALEDAGFEVGETEKNSLEFIAPSGEKVKIKFNHNKNRVIVTVDGNNVNSLDENNLTFSQQPENGINFFECTNVALEIYFLKLDLCEFDTEGLDLLCVPEATFGFALDILRCVQFIGDPM